jgi:ferredoxin
MDQQGLHAIESHCIQEEWPRCQAACPIHVDVRSFMAKMAAGDLAGARKVLDRTMPLPGVLGRICDHPCEAACLRRDLGGVLAIGDLERTCVLDTPPSGKPLCMPGKGKTVAALGGDLSALTLAWDLAKKGYAVTLFVAEAAPGGRLAALPESTLPPEALAEAVEMLGRMGVVVKTGQSLNAALLEEVRHDFSAVYVECVGDNPLGASRTDADPLTLEFGPPGVFCGGWPPGDGSRSVIALAADGRRAAVSIDRLLTGATLTAVRDKEGACPTRAYTNLAGLPVVPRVVRADAPGVSSPDEAQAEAARCLQCECMECVKSCEYLKHYKGYPKVYARQIYNNLSIVQGARSYTKMINSCMLCGLCTEICPEDFSMADLCLSARRDLFSRGKLGPSAHEFALEDMEFSNGPDCALLRAEPGQKACAHLFFPGCQLAGEPDGKIPETYAFLRGKLSGGVGLALGCCGMPAQWSAREELFAQAMDAFRAGWEGLGRPRVIVACASCQSAFAKGAPDIPVISLWRVLAGETGLPEIPGATPPGRLAVHDPCTSRHDPESQAAVRDILARRGIAVEELPLSRNMTQCCGFGGLADNAHAELAAVTTAKRAGQSPNDYVATCAMCRDRLARTGKRTYHLLDLLFPGEIDDPATRPDPGFSTRHEERSHLQRLLLSTVWNEPRDPVVAAGPELVLSPEVLERMEVRRILVEDVAQVVARAEAGGQKFLDRTTGRFLACHRPRRVAFWVEYAMVDGKAVIHNAYCHRMMVFGTSSEARQ